MKNTNDLPSPHPSPRLHFHSHPLFLLLHLLFSSPIPCQVDNECQQEEEGSDDEAPRDIASRGIMDIELSNLPEPLLKSSSSTLRPSLLNATKGMKMRGKEGDGRRGERGRGREVRDQQRKGGVMREKERKKKTFVEARRRRST